jgi:hypothetical protein
MTNNVYNIVKAALGWSIHCDGVKLGGIYGSKEAALEAVTVAAAFAVRDGAGVQINIPGGCQADEIPSNWVFALRPCCFVARRLPKSNTARNQPSENASSVLQGHSRGFIDCRWC